MKAFEAHPRLTALICGNDQMAAGAYLATARLGLWVPQDVTVVGYDDEPLASMLTPKLTTVALPFYELGRRGARTAGRRRAGGVGQAPHRDRPSGQGLQRPSGAAALVPGRLGVRNVVLQGAQRAAQGLVGIDTGRLRASEEGE